ncbi:MAG TPA: group 1 truncated hemoglobin [Pyrinomonadaceae bacterium]|jgi:hemoglobin
MRKNYRRTLGLVVLLFVAGCGYEARAQDNAAAAQGPAQSLYKRLGGYDALAAVTDDFIGRLVADKSLGRFFGGASDDSKKRIRQHVLDQLCAATGGPCLYVGRSMKTVHTGLGITEEDWNVAVKHLTDTLDKFKVPKPEQDELFKIVGTLKADIVEKK